MSNKRRNGEIEVLRLFFTISVLLFHSQFVSNGSSYRLFHGGWLGVEFFFLVSGYLMASYEDRLPLSAENRKIGSDTASYVFRKAMILYPYMAFSIVSGILSWRAFTKGAFFPPYSAVELRQNLTFVLNFIFPYSLGFKNYAYLGYSWYLSAMIWSIMLIFPLLRRSRDLFYCVIAPVFVAFGLGYYSWHYNRLGYITMDNYLFSAGLIRGIAELSMGCLCFKISKQFRNVWIKKNGRIAITVFEILCFVIVIFRVVFITKDSVYDFIIFFVLAVVVAIAFSEQSLAAFQLSDKWSNLSGKLNLALYLNSSGWSHMTARAWPEMSYRKAVAIYLCLSLGSAIVCMAVCGGLQTLWKTRVKEKVYDFLFVKAPEK